MSGSVSVVRGDDVPWEEAAHGGGFASRSRGLSRGMQLGANVERLAPGKASAPFHFHLKADEFFLVLRGRALLRHAGGTVEVIAGDAISCPRGADGAHQFFNHTEEPADILMVGENRADEICGYPDSGKWRIRELGAVGRLTETDYWDGEPDPPLVAR